MSVLPEDGDIKPSVTEDRIVEYAQEIYGFHVTQLKQLNSYDDINYHVVVSKSSNPNCQQPSPLGYIFKIINSEDSKKLEFFEAQSKVLRKLRDESISAPVPIKSMQGQYITSLEIPKKDKLVKYLLIVLNYQKGKILKDVETSDRIYFQVGVWAARLNNALQDLRDPAIEIHSSMWHLKSMPIVKSYLSYVADDLKRKIVTEVADQFSEKILNNINKLDKGIIHGDLNEQNILVDAAENNQWNVCALLDFGDMNHACYLFEIAVAMCYMVLDGARYGKDPLQVGASTLAGYQSIRPLSTHELSLLKIAMCGRLCQSLVLGLYSLSLQPENSYISYTQTKGWDVLQQLWDTPDNTINQLWASQSSI